MYGNYLRTRRFGRPSEEGRRKWKGTGSFRLNRSQLGHGSMKALTTEGVFIGISQKEIPYVTDMPKRLHVCFLSPSSSGLIPAQAGC